MSALAPQLTPNTASLINLNSFPASKITAAVHAQLPPLSYPLTSSLLPEIYPYIFHFTNVIHRYWSHIKKTFRREQDGGGASRQT